MSGHGKDPAAMPKLCMITVPGLRVSSDWQTVHDRLLDEFPEVTDVLATTIKETILVVHEQAAPEDAGRWLDTVNETILYRREHRRARRPVTESPLAQCAGGPRRPFPGAQRVGLVK
jgi:hypothetical protein